MSLAAVSLRQWNPVLAIMTRHWGWNFKFLLEYKPTRRTKEGEVWHTGISVTVSLMGSPFWKGQGGFRLKQNNTLFLCSFLPETETLLKCGAGALTGSYLPVTASFQWFSYQPRRCRAFTVRTCLAAFSGCEVIKAAGILLLKTKNKKKTKKHLIHLSRQEWAQRCHIKTSSKSKACKTC